MNNIVALAPQRSLREYNGHQLALIRKTVAADCNELEFDLYMEVARRVGLDPFRKQIYAVVHNKKDAEKRKLTIITGIDGFRAVAARNHDYRPDDGEPVITYDDAAKSDTNPLGIVKATVKAYKLAPNGEWHAVVGTAHWEEFCPVKEEWAENEQGRRRPTGRFILDPTSNWRKMPRIMICKVAEAQALRRGWPEDLSGIYAEEEMDQLAARDITASVAVEQHEQDRRLRLINAKDTIPVLWAAGEPIEAVPIGQFMDRACAWLKQAESPTQIDWWDKTNTAPFREFWAKHKSDGVALRRAIEERKQELEQ